MPFRISDSLCARSGECSMSLTMTLLSNAAASRRPMLPPPARMTLRTGPVELPQLSHDRADVLARGDEETPRRRPR